MREFELNKINYRVGPMDAFRQIHIVRRLGTVIGDIITPELVERIKMTQIKGDPVGFVAELVGPVTKAFGRMSDEDVEYVVNACMGCVMRQTAPNAWQQVKPAGAPIMFADITPADYIVISGNVIVDQLGNFIPALLAHLPSEETSPTSH